ncbi:hypothetical protein V8C37DRAFT_385193 [Trichoderma ceciliae]
MPQSSKSRTMTATCARLAASATRVKSLRKGSVEGVLTWTGAGAMMAAKLLGDGLVDEAEDDEAFVEEEASMAYLCVRWTRRR